MDSLEHRALKNILLGKTTVKELNLTEFFAGRNFCCMTTCFDRKPLFPIMRYHCTGCTKKGGYNGKL